MIDYLKILLVVVLSVGFCVGAAAILGPAAVIVTGVGTLLIIYFVFRKEADQDIGWDRTGNPFKDL